MYARQTEPLVAYYQKRGELFEVDGAREVEAVRQDLLKIIEKL